MRHFKKGIPGKKTGEPGYYPVNQHFVDWLNEGDGRAAYFQRIDKALVPPLVSKMKSGSIAITIDYALRLERAQKPSLNPFRAIDIMTFEDERELLRYALGLVPPPSPVRVIHKKPGPRTQPMETAGA